MAELPRYQGIQTRVASGAEAQRVKARTIDQFIQGVKSIEGDMYNMAAQQSTMQAKQEAEQAFQNEGLNAEIGDSMTVYGQQYRATLEGMHKKKMAIDINKKFNDLYTQYEDNPLAFEEVSNAYRDKTIKEIPEHLRAEFAIDYEANKASFSGRVKQNRINKDKEEAVAVGLEFFNQKTDSATQAAREGAYERALVEMSAAKDSIYGLKDAGLMDEQTADKKIRQIDQSMTRANFKGINDNYIEDGDLEGAQTAIDKFRDTTIPGLNDMEREALADDMQRDLNVEYKRQKAMVKENTDHANIQVDDAIKILKEGKLPDNVEDLKDSLELVSDKKKHEFNIQAKAYNKSMQIDNLSLPDQLNAVSVMEAEPIASREDIEVLATIKANLKEKLSLAKKDMITLGAQDGLYEPTESILPGGDTSKHYAIISERMRQANISNGEYGVEKQIFTAPEAEQWVNYINDRDTSIADKMNLIKTIEESTNGKGHIAYRQLLKDKRASVFTAAGDFYAEGRGNVSQMLLHGDMVLNSEMGASIDRKELTAKLNSALGNTFSRSTKADRDKVISSVTAYYASLAEGYGALGDESYQYADQAIEEVLGKQGIRNGQGYFAPIGMDSDDVDDYIEDLSNDDLTTIQGIPPEATKEVIENSKLIQVENGKYRLIYQNHSVSNTDGTPYILEIK